MDLRSLLGRADRPPVDGPPPSVLSAETWGPSRFSSRVAAAAVVLGTAGLCYTRGLTRAGVLAATTAGLVALGVGFRRRPGQRYTAVANLLSVVAAFGLGGSLAFPLLRSPLQPVQWPLLRTSIALPIDVLVVTIAFLAVLGALVGVQGQFDADSFLGVVRTVAYAAVTVTAFFAWTLAIYLDRAVAAFGWFGDWIAFLFRPHPPGVHLLLAALTVVAYGAYAVVRTEPIPPWVRHPRLKRIRGLLEDAGTGVSRVAFSLLLITLVTITLNVAGGVARLLAVAPPAVRGLVTAVGTSTALRGVLLLVGLSLFAVAAAVKLVRWLLVRWRLTLPRLAASSLPGVTLVVGLAVAPTGSLTRQLLAGRPGTASTLGALGRAVMRQGPRAEAAADVFWSFALVGVLLAWAAGFVLLVFLTWSNVVPERAGGFAVASGCLVAMSILVTLAGAPAYVLFAGIALAFASWDVGEFSTSLGREIGRVAPTRQGEVVHTLAAVGVGVVAIVAPLLLTAVARAVTSPAPRDALVVALVVSVLGSLLFLALLRG